MTVAIYIRVSTEEQAKEGFSIGAQKDLLKAYCISQGWESYKFYVDEGLSAKDTNRPQLKTMISHIEDGLINKVLVYRLDRITRSVRDLHELLETFDSHNCAFISSTEPYDTSTAAGRLFITLVAAIAQWERENTGERISMVLGEKAKSGEWVGKAPYGFMKYKKKVDGKEINALKQNEQTVPVLKDMIGKVFEGYSMRRLTNYLDDSGVQPVKGYKWHIASVLAMLKNPALYGAMRWKGEIYEDRCEGIMTKEEHEHLLKVLSERQHKKKRAVNSFFVYQMKLKCPACDNHMTSERHSYVRKTDNVLVQHNRYRCQPCALNRRPAMGCSEKNVDSAFVEYMEKLSIKELPIIEDDHEKKMTELEGKIKRVGKQREKYQRAWSNDLISDDEFTERMNETKELVKLWKEELDSIKPSELSHFDNDSVMEIVNDFNKNWNYLEPKERHHFLNRFIEKIDINKAGRDVIIEEVTFY